MARKRRRAKTRKHRKIKGRGYFSNNRYNTFNYSRKRKQYGGLLSRYDFAYAGRDTINQAGKVLEKVGPALIKTAVEELYQTSFRLLETKGKKKYNEIKRNVSNKLKKLKII